MCVRACVHSTGCVCVFYGLFLCVYICACMHAFILRVVCGCSTGYFCVYLIRNMCVCILWIKYVCISSFRKTYSHGLGSGYWRIVMSDILCACRSMTLMSMSRDDGDFPTQRFNWFFCVGPLLSTLVSLTYSLTLTWGSAVRSASCCKEFNTNGEFYGALLYRGMLYGDQFWCQKNVKMNNNINSLCNLIGRRSLGKMND